ncbi:MAG: molybdopterin-dependent oxidoreductase [Acidimicrobiia bacterium]|nr:molybdopterin-dependent oxidoreductase [Acidimicrobiia bacterium]
MTITAPSPSTRSVLGGTVRRREDPALVQGLGLYVDDVKRAGTLSVAFVRSPFAHARITSIDTTAAMDASGVRAVYTADDVRHLGPLLAQIPIGKLRPLLADGTVHHSGEAVAMVVADSRYAAQDAAELVEVDYESLPAVVDLKKAVADEVKTHEDLDSNVIHVWEAGPFGDEDGIAASKQAIADAKERDDTITVSLEMVNQRLIPTAIEPRSVIADWSEGYQRLEVHSSTQIPHALAGAIAKTLDMPTNQVRVIAPEVGGGFGAKLNVYNDEILVSWASRKLGVPVKFTETRREAAVSTIHGRAWLGMATIVGTEDGEVLGYELDAICDMGAYSQNFTVAIPFLGMFVGSGQYKFPTSMVLNLVTTNTMTTDAYRGAGRPEAIYYLERILDHYARQIGMDPADVRRKNFIPAEDFPGAMAPIGFAMDTGDYSMNLDALLETTDYEGWKAERDAARSENRHVGIGLATYVEVCGFGPSALVDLGFSWTQYGLPAAFSGTGLVRVNPDGTVTVITGTGPSGQGHETTWAQIVSSELGIPVEKIRVSHGDTGDSTMGIGTFGSRSAAVDGAATFEAAQQVREKAVKIAAHALEASEDDIELNVDGASVAGSPDSAVGWEQLLTMAYQPHLLPDGMSGGLEAQSIFSPANATWPFGSHLAMVEVDPETGHTKVLKYTAMDDCGNVINPMIVAGQVHGGIAQGLGQAMFEEGIYDEDGNMLTPSFMDYIIPTAADLPMFDLHRTTTPSDINPLGVKGIGEAGTIGSAQTIVNAVADALSPLGIDHVDMPLRSKNVWKAIQTARSS